MNRERLGQTGPDAALESRIASFELAFRMQAAAPGLQEHFAAKRPQTLSALRPRQSSEHRRLRPPMPHGPPLRRSRRAFHPGDAQLQVGPAQTSSAAIVANNAMEVDRPIAGLASRAMKQPPALAGGSRLVIWGGEFDASTPTAQGRRWPRPQPAGLPRCGSPAPASDRGLAYGAHRRMATMPRTDKVSLPRSERHDPAPARP